MSSTRRAALCSLASALTVSLAGCAGIGVRGVDDRANRTDTSTSEPTPTPTETPQPTATPFPTPYPPEALTVEELGPVSRGVPGPFDTTGVASDPFTVLAVGERSQVQSEERKPHQLWVWNDADESHEMTLTLANPRGTVFERSVRFDANTKLAVVLRVPSAYEFTVALDDTNNTTETVEVPFSRFDCNDSATDVVVRDNGSIETSTITTELACSIPTPTSG